MPRDQKGIQQPKRNRGDDKQVYRCDTIGMMAKEGFPALRWWPPFPSHVFCNGSLADVDPELEQFAVNPWRSPQRVGNAHLANKVANVRGDPWPAAAPS
jgi:hypothetical protein